MEPNNPIAQALNESIPSTIGDKKRPLEGFIKCASFSHEYERLQRQHLSLFITENSPLPDKIHYLVAQAMQIGFEAGKLYIMNGHVENMLRMEETWNEANPDR